MKRSMGRKSNSCSAVCNRGRNHAIQELPSNASHQISRIRKAFWQQPVGCTDGSIEAVDGSTWAALEHYKIPDVAELPSKEAVLKWRIGHDPTNPNDLTHPTAAGPQPSLEDSATVGLSNADVGVNNIYAEANRNMTIKLKASQDQEHGIMHLRDPSNKISIGHQLLATGQPASQLPQLDSQLKPPRADKCIKDPAVVCQQAPLLEESVIMDWARQQKMVAHVDGIAYKGESCKRGVALVT
eukprot:6190373-Pleurochrysis_carterae.AAC.2